jgi:hypothetical protein
MFPIRHLTVGLLHAVNRDTLAVMARGTAQLLGWVGIIGKQRFASRVGLERMRLFLETRSIDRRMTSLTAIHTGNRLIESIAVELL